MGRAVKKIRARDAQEPGVGGKGTMNFQGFVKRVWLPGALAGMTVLSLLTLRSHPLPMEKPSPAVKLLADESTDKVLDQMRAYFEEKGLNWHAFRYPYAKKADKFCAASFLPPTPSSYPHSYHIECADTLASAFSAIVSDYAEDKPGYEEVIVLGQGERQEVE